MRSFCTDYYYYLRAAADTRCTDRVHAIVVLQKKEKYGFYSDGWVELGPCVSIVGWAGLGEEKWTHVHLWCGG